MALVVPESVLAHGGGLSAAVTALEYLRTLSWVNFLAALVVGVGFGYLLGGRASRIHVPWHVPTLVFLALAIQLVLGRISSIDVPVTLVAYLLTYLLAGVALVLIWRHLGNSGARWLGRFALAMLAAGWILNTSVIALNSGIPVSQSALEEVGLQDADSSKELLVKDVHRDGALSAETRLGFLGDVIPVRPLGGVFSIGDVMFNVGLGALIAASMVGTPVRGATSPRKAPRPTMGRG